MSLPCTPQPGEGLGPPLASWTATFKLIHLGLLGLLLILCLPHGHTAARALVFLGPCVGVHSYTITDGFIDSIETLG